MQVWLRLQHLLDLFEDFQLELKEVVIVQTEESFDGLCRDATDLQVLVRQLEAQ